MKRFILSLLLFITTLEVYTQTKILYVDSFDHICGIKVQEDSLFKFTKSNGFNTFYLYDLNTVTQNTIGKVELGSFISKSHNLGIKCIGVAGDNKYINSPVTNSRRSYQLFMKDTLSKQLDGVNLEREFWRYPREGTCTFPYWVNTLAYMQMFCAQFNITGDFYIGQLNDKENTYTDAEVASYMVKGTSRILLSDYVTTDQYISDPTKYIKTRLSTIGNEARNQSKIIEVVVIFSGTKDYMNSYFKTHTPLQVYNTLLNRYKQINFAGKSNIRIIGYACYSYQELRYITTLNK